MVGGGQGPSARGSSASETSSTLAGTEGKLCRVTQRSALCIWQQATSCLPWVWGGDKLAVTGKPRRCPRWGQTGLIPGGTACSGHREL